MDGWVGGLTAVLWIAYSNQTILKVGSKTIFFDAQLVMPMKRLPKVCQRVQIYAAPNF